MSPPLIDRQAFLDALNLKFPEIFREITDIEIGLLHPEMGVVSHASRAAVEAEDWDKLTAQFKFVQDVFLNGDSDIKNAVYVSYLENIFLGETSARFSKARELLPRSLADALLELEAHFEMLQKHKLPVKN